MLEDLTTLLYRQTADTGVATITLNRPQAMNAFDAVMVEEFGRVWDHVRSDQGVRAVVLRASGDRAFCTGVDVRQPGIMSREPNIWNQRDPGEVLGPKARKCWKPVITAVHGLCAGGAFYWINESDIVICSEDAQFFDPHVTYGMTAALEPIGLTHRMPLGDVLRLALLGNDERISAQTALRLGLVSEVTTRDALWDRANHLATLIAAKPAVAIQGTVRAIWESLEFPRTAGLQAALKYCQIGNPLGVPEVDRAAVMAGAKTFEVR